MRYAYLSLSLFTLNASILIIPFYTKNVFFRMSAFNPAHNEFNFSFRELLGFLLPTLFYYHHLLLYPFSHFPTLSFLFSTFS